MDLRCPSPGRAAFTLVELLVAATLLILMFMACSFIFGTTTQAVGEAEGVTEVYASLSATGQVIRNDIRAIEPGGYLAFGGRQFAGNPAVYGNNRMKQAGRSSTIRADWIAFTTNTHQMSNVDPRLVGQCGRVIYGHGKLTDPAANVNVATNWAIIRHAYILGGRNVSKVQKGISGLTDAETSIAFMMHTYAQRDFQWYGQGYPIHEPANFFAYLSSGTLAWYMRHEQWTRYLLPGCAEFRIDYAMPEDLRSPGVAWRSAPLPGAASNPQDPNFRTGDPLHTDRTNSAGRLVFGPGDRWPALLRISLQVYDQAERVDDARSTLILRVP